MTTDTIKPEELNPLGGIPTGTQTTTPSSIQQTNIAIGEAEQAETQPVSQPVSEPIMITSGAARTEVAKGEQFIASKQPVEETEEEIPPPSKEEVEATETTKDFKDGRDKGGLTREEAGDIFGTDFTGVHFDEKTGLFFPDSSAIERLTPEEKEEQDRAQQLRETADKIDSQFAEYQTQLSADFGRQVESIRSQFGAQRRRMEDINKRQFAAQQQFGHRIGTSRFAPLTAQGILFAEEQAGAARIGELIAMEQEAIARATSAFHQQKFSVMMQQVDVAQQMEDRIQNELEKVRAAQVERNKVLEDQQRQIEIESSIFTLVAGGITKPEDIAFKLGVPIKNVAEVMKSMSDDQVEKTLTGKAQEFQSFINAGLIDETLPKREQWEAYLDLMSDDPLLTDTQLKLYGMPFGTRQSDIMGKFGISAPSDPLLTDAQLKAYGMPFGTRQSAITGRFAQDSGKELGETERRQTQERVDGAESLLSLLNQYRDIVAEKGYTNRFIGDKEVLGKVTSLRAQMTAAYKKANTLGTLDEGVLQLMEQLLGVAPESGYWPLENFFGGKGQKIVSAIDSLIDTTTVELERDKGKLGGASNPFTQDELDEIETLLGEDFNPESFY